MGDCGGGGAAPAAPSEYAPVNHCMFTIHSSSSDASTRRQRARFDALLNIETLESTVENLAGALKMTDMK